MLCSAAPAILRERALLSSSSVAERGYGPHLLMTGPHRETSCSTRRPGLLPPGFEVKKKMHRKNAQKKMHQL